VPFTKGVVEEVRVVSAGGVPSSRRPIALSVNVASSTTVDPWCGASCVVASSLIWVSATKGGLGGSSRVVSSMMSSTSCLVGAVVACVTRSPPASCGVGISWPPACTNCLDFVAFVLGALTPVL